MVTASFFAWPKCVTCSDDRTPRDDVIKELRHYQDWTGVHVAVVFDGQGDRVSEFPSATTCKIFYARRGQSADAYHLSRLSGKYDHGSK